MTTTEPMPTIDTAWPGRHLRVSDAELFVRDSGGTSAAIVFLHGLGGYAAEWWPVATELLETFRVIAFDQRGQGRSTTAPQDLTRDAFVNDTIAVIDHADAGPVVLVGQSMGAHTALLTAARRPDLVTQLVLIEGGVGGEGAEASREVIDWFRSWPAAFASRQDAASWFEGQGYRPDAARAWAGGLQETPGGLVPRFVPSVLLRQLLAVHLEDRLQEWRGITCPTLLVKGEHGFIPAAEFTQMLSTNPRASMVEVPDAGHDVHLDAPVDIVDLIRSRTNAR